MNLIKTPAADQRPTAIRQAFIKALYEHPVHTKLTGQVYRALCTTAGLVRI